MRTATDKSRLSISVRGVVQGVGFRPFVYQLAGKHGLTGWVANTSGDVKIEVEGSGDALDLFLSELESLAPPVSHISDISSRTVPVEDDAGFEIRNSVSEAGEYQLVSPDIATCHDCLREILDPGDRRYRYPFTNCTNCGPRFTIIEDIPYDRPRTTMKKFSMCPECGREYEDPLDRRFHAQPNACPVCGPALFLANAEGKPVECDDVLRKAVDLLKEGGILAVKGLGGFLLACDATNDAAVAALRERKHRPGKPFAVMLKDIGEVKRHCEVSPAEEKLLSSPKAPIVLLHWKEGSTISPSVAGGLKTMGVMLPYTPLHHLLLREAGLPLVMTSGNLSEEPIAKDNDEALGRLRGIADFFLLHDRDIYSRYDDSVTMVELGEPQMVRRARGYAPYPIHLPFEAKQVLACGAELKNSFCLTRDENAFVSQHIGDLENLETLEHFTDTIELYRKLFRIEPELIACDMHPEYLSTKYAKELSVSAGLPIVEVQHHHAHIAACLADNGLDERVIGVALDGTGYGSDGAIWGGEFLMADYAGFDRLGHLEYIPMPGGSAAIMKPYRMALGYLYTLFGDLTDFRDLPFLRDVDADEIELVRQQMERGINTPLTSSCGRLFDAVAALAGIRGIIDYEAQAAIELETAAEDGETSAYPFSIIEENGVNIVYLKEMFSAVIADVENGIGPGKISARFHNAVAGFTAEMCRKLAETTGISKVALSGGVFQNRLLLRLVSAALKREGLEVLTHKNVPANDGCISLGQAAVANFAAGRSG